MTAGVVGAGGVALLVDVCVLSQLRKRGANALVVLLAALGVTIVLQNCMAIVWVTMREWYA